LNGTDRPAQRNRVLAVPRRAALIAITVLVAAATSAAFAESYRGLYDWAAGHGLTGEWAVIWPLQVDVFIAVGELALFVALVDRWAPRSRTAAWAVTAAGLAVSVAGNVGHVASHSLLWRATAAVPPVAAAAALAVALGILKRIVEADAGHRRHEAGVPAAEPVRVTEGRPPSAWLDDQILALLPRMSVRSTAQALGVSKTRIETAKRRAALTVPDRGQGGLSAPPALATQNPRPGQGLSPRPVPAGSNGQRHG
jgi:Protein of unknown function (DUF2637)